MRARVRWLDVLALAGALTTVAVTAADVGALSVRAWPRTTADPGYVELMIHHHPSSGDRHLLVEIDSGDFFRRSVIELDGERASPTHWIRFKQLPRGSYVARVAIEGQGEERPLGTDSFRVVGNSE